MNAPQITLIAIWGLSLGIALSAHGKPQIGKHSFATVAITIAFYAALLWWGGFWK